MSRESAIATLSIINFVCIIILITFILLFFGRIVDMENYINDLERYRKDNEIQLNNLIDDINKNDRLISEKIKKHQTYL
jgi:uncharacterized membrane protein YvbJ